jgi:hypothetical protein
MLGFRGHFSTKTRRYSTTLGALRDARAEYRRAQTNPHPEETTYVLAHWSFAGTGLTSRRKLVRRITRTRPRHVRRTHHMSPATTFIERK